MNYEQIIKERFEVIELLGMKALFTEERIDDDELPYCLHRYDLSETDDADVFLFGTIEPYVRDMHAGTILTLDEIDLGTDRRISFEDVSEDEYPGFDGSYMTVEEYVRYYEITKDKKHNMEYWDGIDEIGISFVKELIGASVKTPLMDSIDKEDCEFYVAKRAIETAVKELKGYGYEFPYIDENY